MFAGGGRGGGCLLVEADVVNLHGLFMAMREMAMREQPGLQLEATKGTVDVLVVDSLKRLSEN